jgi:RNA polymerase sigma-70 factor (ECF subfamily)
MSHRIETNTDVGTVALKQLFNQYRPSLLAIAIKLTRQDRQLAEELVQETLDYAIQHRLDLTEHSRARAVLHTLLRDRFLSYLRRQRLRASTEVDQLALPAEFLVEAAKQLPRDLQQVYEMIHVQKLSYRETALRLGMKVSTVGTRLIRARHLLGGMVLAPVDPTNRAWTWQHLRSSLQAQFSSESTNSTRRVLQRIYPLARLLIYSAAFGLPVLFLDIRSPGLFIIPVFLIYSVMAAGILTAAIRCFVAYKLVGEGEQKKAPRDFAVDVIDEIISKDLNTLSTTVTVDEG